MTNASKKTIPETKMSRLDQIQSRKDLKLIGRHFKEKIEIKHKKWSLEKKCEVWIFMHIHKHSKKCLMQNNLGWNYQITEQFLRTEMYGSVV